VFHRWPSAQRAVLRLLDAWFQIALFPFRRPRQHGSAREDAALIARTEDYNAAAERYFREFPNPDYLLDKPYSETHATAKHLIDVGVLMDAMRLRPGDVVAELGAGSCWLSYALNRFGCRTIALDVSATALALGRRLFEQGARTRWDLDPQFVAYDGHTLPLPSASCDRVVINDAFHHIPNQREVLSEIYRVLKADGVLAMAEPGRGHGDADQSRRETMHAGVLENELALEDVAALAMSCGFTRVNVVLTAPLVKQEIPASELGAFMGGRGFSAYWKAFCSALEQHHYVLCYKGLAMATTARPSRLVARLEVIAGSDIRCRIDEPVTVTVRVTNIGDTAWLASEGEGWTRLGVHLNRESGEPVDFDWHRQTLPADVPAGEDVTLVVRLPPIHTPGSYSAVFDVVAEGLAWFADRGSQTAAVRIVAGREG